MKTKAPRYWLMKSEPDVFGIDVLRARPKQTEPWDGVRNYQVRNMLRDDFQIGDRAFFYHSSCADPGIVGIVRVVRAGYPDDSAMNPESAYYDPKHTQGAPRWYRVDVKFERKFSHVISLDELRSIPELKDMLVLRRGNRLSITPVTSQEWNAVISLAQ